MKRVQRIAVLLATTALSTNVFAAGENISNEPLLPTPTEAEKKDSDGFLGEILGVPPDQSRKKHDLTKFFTLDENEFLERSRFGDGGIFAPGANIGTESGSIDRSLDNGLTFNDRVRLNFDTSFTGQDRLRVRLEADPEDSLFGGLDDVIYGGSETLTTDGGSDLIYGGDDSIYSGSDGDLIYGGAPDSITAQTLFGGGPTDDSLYGGTSTDPVFNFFENDLHYAMPAFGGQDLLRPAEQPRITANVRDEVAIGFNVGFDYGYEDYIGLRYDAPDASVNDSYENVPSEPIRLTVGARIETEPVKLTSYTFTSDYGQTNAQTTDAFGGFAFPDLFIERGPAEASTWPPRGDGTQPIEPFYKPPPGQQINIVPTGIIIFQPSEPPDDVFIGTLRTTFKF